MPGLAVTLKRCLLLALFFIVAFIIYRLGSPLPRRFSLKYNYVGQYRYAGEGSRKDLAPMLVYREGWRENNFVVQR